DDFNHHRTVTENLLLRASRSFDCDELAWVASLFDGGRDGLKNADRKGFADVVIRAALNGFDCGINGCLRGHQDYLGLRTQRAAKTPEHFEAAHSIHHHIAKDQIKLDPRGEVQ